VDAVPRDLDFTIQYRAAVGPNSHGGHTGHTCRRISDFVVFVVHIFFEPCAFTEQHANSNAIKAKRGDP
jgi:hypothetical protein